MGNGKYALLSCLSISFLATFPAQSSPVEPKTITFDSSSVNSSVDKNARCLLQQTESQNPQIAVPEKFSLEFSPSQISVESICPALKEISQKNTSSKFTSFLLQEKIKLHFSQLRKFKKRQIQLFSRRRNLLQSFWIVRSNRLLPNLFRYH